MTKQGQKPSDQKALALPPFQVLKNKYDADVSYGPSSAKHLNYS